MGKDVILTKYKIVNLKWLYICIITISTEMDYECGTVPIITPIEN